ncbi:glycosyltransferase family 2 protein [Cognatitamlana onchidii]|uniref:glycosyltransferase family 2 protein n=1 Tax=Cognatitamlana onchidii TaxID=2562860 RepID=UPI0010A6560A|nr:glycosyltransferase family 2 protein [Algibacter onchidii]
MPKVSIVLCSYNGEKYISEQIDSILNQSFKDFELIISDDRSTDSTIKILKTYADKDSRIKWHINESNLGYVKNFEKGISLANGNYILLSDQDDIWDLTKIEKLYNNIEDHALIYCDSLFVNSNLESTEKKMSSSKNMISTTNPLNLCLANSVSGHAMMFKKELTAQLFPFPKLVPHDWWIAFVASFNGGIVYFNDALIKYRIHDSNSLALNKNRKSKENKITKRQLRIDAFYKKCPDNNGAKPILFELNEVYQNINLKTKIKKLSLFFKYKHELFLITKKKDLALTHYILRQFNKLK